MKLRQPSAIAVLLLSIAFLTGTVVGQSSGVDLSFNVVPDKDLASFAGVQFLLQPDDKIIVFGAFQILGGALTGGVARLNPDGTRDQTFLCTVCDFNVTNALLQPDGKIIISGVRNLSPRVYRLDPDGSVDPSFSAQLPPTEFGWTLSGTEVTALRPDGFILILLRTTAPNNFRERLYLLSPNGLPFPNFVPLELGTNHGFGFGVRTDAGKVVSAPDGKFFASTNYFNGANYQGIGTLKRYSANGVLDTTYGGVTATIDPPAFFSPGGIWDFDLAADGSVIIVGQFNVVNGLPRMGAVRITPQGDVDTTFNTTAFDTLSKVRYLPDGKILVSNATRFFRLNADGSTDDTFNSPEIFAIEDWDIDSAGRIVVLKSDRSFLRLGPSGSLENSFDVDIGTPAAVTAAAALGDRVVFAGEFLRVNGISLPSFAQVNNDGTLDPDFDPGSGFSPKQVSKLIGQPDGKVIAIGEFVSYNGMPRRAIARVNSDGSLDGTFTPDIPAGVINTAALQPDGKILIGGTFSVVNGVIRTGVARLEASGGIDTTFNPMFGSPSIQSVVVQSDGKIMVGGSFTGVNGSSRKNLVRLDPDGSLDQAFNPEAALAVFSGLRQVDVQPDGSYLLLYPNTILRLNKDGSRDTSFEQIQTESFAIDQMLALGDGSILVGGDFLQINGVARLHIARLGPDGSVDTTFLPSGANGRVISLTGVANGRVIVTGDFSTIGGVIRTGIARLNVSPLRSVTPFDFDGDGRADIAVFRPSTGIWYQLRSSDNTFHAFHFGQAGDQIAPADYDGDGRTDVAVFRANLPGSGNGNGGTWYITNSTNGSITTVYFRTHGANDSVDIAVPGDWDGDGKADLAHFSEGFGVGTVFVYQRSLDGQVIHTYFGSRGDKPVIGDFDADGKIDPAVFRPSNGFWYAWKTSNGEFIQTQYGLSTDILTPADFDGDEAANIAVFRPSTGIWYTSLDPVSNYGATHFGSPGDIPIPADYDGDGKSDIAVFRPATGVWYVLGSTSGFTAFHFGSNGDIPVPGAFVR